MGLMGCSHPGKSPEGGLFGRVPQGGLLGSPKDAEDAQAIQQAVPEAVNLAGKTSLVDAIDLMSCAELVVSNDRVAQNSKLLCRGAWLV